jgi:hypothetical protein
MQPRRPDPGPPEWLVRWFFDRQAPARGEVDFSAYAAMRFLGGPNAERDAWFAHEAALLAVWVGPRPGTRPPAWWRFSAPEPRAQVAGAALERGGQVDAYGLPVELEYGAHGPLAFEAEGAFLRRLGLLLPGERVPAPTVPEQIPGTDGEELEEE